MVIFGIDLVLLIPALMISATPVLLAAIGEAVVEKSGVLNLGVAVSYTHLTLPTILLV